MHGTLRGVSHVDTISLCVIFVADATFVPAATVQAFDSLVQVGILSTFNKFWPEPPLVYRSAQFIGKRFKVSSRLPGYCTRHSLKADHVINT
jgi:hypothetical protein